MAASEETDRLWTVVPRAAHTLAYLLGHTETPPDRVDGSSALYPPFSSDWVKRKGESRIYQTRNSHWDHQ